jgi:hypothetical protein
MGFREIETGCSLMLLNGPVHKFGGGGDKYAEIDGF